jgi:acetyl-CoA acetyltransferase
MTSVVLRDLWESTTTEAFVLGGARTPFTRYGGSLSHIRLDDLLGLAMTGACDRVGIGLDQIEDVVAGCANPAHEGIGHKDEVSRSRS